jgi:hypothetical protein
MRRVLRRVLIVLVALVGVARAECPVTGDAVTCRPWSALLMPTLVAALYVPNDANGPYVGGGVELAFTWSDNSHAFGPSHGRARFDIVALDGTAMSAGAMVMYRGGAQMSFERSASRRWLIPFFAADIGGLWSRATDRRGFVDAGVGLYVVHRRNAIVDIEVDGVLPFSDLEKLGGARATLAAAFSLW